MSQSRAKIRDVLTAFLLAVAVSLVWPSMGPFHDHSAHATSHHVASAHAHEHGHAGLHPNCVPSGMGCCSMTHCHPGVSPPP